MANKDKKRIITVAICMFVSFILWTYVMSDRNPIQTRTITNVPVELVNQYSVDQANLVILPEQSFSVDITITGRALKVFGVETKDFKLVADMDTYLKKGDNTIPVTVKSIPDGISMIDERNVSYIRVKLDTAVRKSVPVDIKVTGKEKEGFSHINPIVRPTEVMVTGPESYVNSVSKVEGEVDISGYSENINASILVKPVDKDENEIPSINMDSKYTDVFVEIKPSKEVPIVVKTINKMQTNKSLKLIKPEFDKIRIIGDGVLIQGINAINTAPVDLSKVINSEKVNVPLIIPKGIVLADDTKSINVRLDVENNVEKTLTLPIKILNKDPDYEYNLSEANVTVSLRGEAKIIKTLDANICSASIDVINYSEGNYLMNVTIDTPDGVEIRKIIPAKINLKVMKKGDTTAEPQTQTQN